MIIEMTWCPNKEPIRGMIWAHQQTQGHSRLVAKIALGDGVTMIMQGSYPRPAYLEPAEIGTIDGPIMDSGWGGMLWPTHPISLNQRLPYIIRQSVLPILSMGVFMHRMLVLI